MPWEHCGQSVADDVSCPTCALSKAQWSIKFDATRTFQVSRRPAAMLNLELIDLDLEPVHHEAFRGVLPGGKEITGVTDVEGRSIISSPAGKYTVDFHRLKAKQLVKPQDAEPAAKVAARFLVPTGRKQTFQLTGIFLDFDVEAEDEFMDVVGIPWVLITPDGLEDGTLDETRRVRVFCPPDWLDGKVTLELFSGPLVHTEFEVQAEDEWRDVVGIPYTLTLKDGTTREGIVDESRVVRVKTRQGDEDGISLMLHLSEVVTTFHIKARGSAKVEGLAFTAVHPDGKRVDGVVPADGKVEVRTRGGENAHVHLELHLPDGHVVMAGEDHHEHDGCCAGESDAPDEEVTSAPSTSTEREARVESDHGCGRMGEAIEA